jgi:cyclopropane fatty-acyl-phospholipid synthase-like methyltransferase
LTVAAIKAVHHFIRRSSSDNFYDFIHEFPKLKTSFRELISSHYRTDTFQSAKAREIFIEPDLSPFDELFMNEFPERLTWAIELMNINPSESILEIGCGTGLLAELIASKLTKGHLCAIDKSGAILTKAKKRNARLVSEKKVTFIGGDFDQVEIPDLKIDRVVAFNVGFFKKDGTKELRRIEKLMKKKTGALYVFYQDPGSHLKKETVETIEKHLKDNNFRVIKKHVKRFHDTEACCIVSRPA